ncbi:MAG TPA: hypothetical protein VFZ23_03935 [Pyrinomonadaceae bacterium]
MKKCITLILYVLPFTGLLFLASDASAQLIISEFRVRGPNGANDEFVEIYNNSGADHTVAGGGTGYAVAGSNGVARCVIPNGTVIPNRGHYLCVNSVGYSLASYPAGNGTTAVGNATYTTDIPDNSGIAIFRTSLGVNFTLGNRMDAVGSTSEANTLYKEGTGYPALTPFSINYSFYRDDCGKGGSITSFGWCTLDGPKDTNNNAADFIFVDTNGTSAGAGQRLGAPGPQNLSSPQKPSQSIPTVLVNSLDSCVSQFSPPNAVRDFTSDPANNSTFGTIDLRFRITNRTGASTTRLRFRIIDLTTFPAPSGIADLRPRTSTAVVVTTDNAPCGSGTSNVTVNGTTLEQPPSQPNGGGFNSSLSAGTITLATPLANGASTNVRLLFGIQQNGAFKVGLAVETLPGGGKVHYVEGSTSPLVNFSYGTPFDFGSDFKSDISIFRPSNGQWWYRRSNDGVSVATTFGVSTDRTMPGDYTGDGISDRAFYRPSTGQWFVLRSENSSFYAVPFGNSTDFPVPGDFDGDGKVDLAVFRPSVGEWFLQSSATGITTVVPWGASTDLPVPADYDGDRKTDVAIWRPNGGAGGEWWIRYSGGGNAVFNFGLSTDKAVPGDYTGDGRADVAFWRPSTGQWFILRSEDVSFFAAPFGVSTDLPVPTDYDGDRRTDLAVFRPGTATWFIRNSNGGSTTILNYGLGTDQPLPNTYVR